MQRFLDVHTREFLPLPRTNYTGESTITTRAYGREQIEIDASYNIPSIPRHVTRVIATLATLEVYPNENVVAYVLVLDGQDAFAVGSDVQMILNGTHSACLFYRKGPYYRCSPACHSQ